MWFPIQKVLSATKLTATARFTVIGANPIWDNSGYLYVGRYGEGTVTIENGGRVENTNGYIGIYADAVGTVTVTGTGSTWDNNDDLYVGGWDT